MNAHTNTDTHTHSDTYENIDEKDEDGKKESHVKFDNLASVLSSFIHGKHATVTDTLVYGVCIYVCVLWG